MELWDFNRTSIHKILEGIHAAADEDFAVAPASIERKPICTDRLISFELDVTTDAAAKSGLRVVQIAEAGGEVKRTEANRIRSGKEASHA